MNAEIVSKKISDALGNPQSGAIAEAMPLIMGAIAAAYADDETKAVRITKAAETR